MFPTREKNKNRGFTLVEISVVLAIVAVIAVMTVSFVALVGTQSQIAKNSADISSDISEIEKNFRDFILSYDDSSCSFSVSADSADKTSVKVVGGDVNVSFSLKDKTISYTRPDGQIFTRTLNRVESASFSVLKDNANKNSALCCTFSYKTANGKSEESKTVIRTVRAAQVVGESV